MSAAAAQNGPATFFPLEHGERAAHLNVNQLLAGSLYEELARLIRSSVPTSMPGSSKHEEKHFATGRSHSTIFLDGGRGTGKTTVLVNLGEYLKAMQPCDEAMALDKLVHVLKPVDPALLEDGDDLFLNVIMAAILSDKAVLAAKGKEEEWTDLQNRLQSLGESLRGLETQQRGVGLDRLRAFVSAQDLAWEVHDVFCRVAALLGKRLLVLPIDDVDTTLHRAYADLEVVRRYLASPVLLPVVSGDLTLYREVVWRDMFKRLALESELEPAATARLAEQLANEYLRKILPVHRRLRMPDVGKYLHGEHIQLGSEPGPEEDTQLSLPDLAAWLEAMLAGTVNGHENSRLSLPIPTVRALSQLVSRVGPSIAALQNAVRHPGEAIPEVRLLRMMRPLLAVGENWPISAPDRTPSPTWAPTFLADWRKALLDHFSFEPSAGAVCLVLMAQQHWQERAERSVLATPLFQPMQQVADPSLAGAERRAKLSWDQELRERLPDSWINALPSHAILPFATPEVGRAVAETASWSEVAGHSEDPYYCARQHLFVDLITHRNFYTPSKRAVLICSGRVLELLITSLVRDLNVGDVRRILSGAPFHSAVAVASTKPMHVAVIEEGEDGDEGEDGEVAAPGSGDEPPSSQDLGHPAHESTMAIQQIVEAINAWRQAHQLAQLHVSPWLIYNALNKTFNQVPMFIRPRRKGSSPTGESLAEVLASGLAAFHAFWAALGSFEKGPLFDLPVEISNVNLLSTFGSFKKSELYTQNVLPLVNLPATGPAAMSVTRTLDYHPLRVSLAAHLDDAKIAARKQALTLMKQTLRVSPTSGRFTQQSIQRALTQHARSKTPAQFGTELRRKVETIDRNLPELKFLGAAIASLSQRPSRKR